MIKLKPEPKGNAKSPIVPIPVTVIPDIIVTKRGRGRPCTGKAMTNAQRQAKFKALRKAACRQP
jgi:hypothetical protein